MNEHTHTHTHTFISRTPEMKISQASTNVLFINRYIFVKDTSKKSEDTEELKAKKGKINSKPTVFLKKQNRPQEKIKS